MKSFATLPPLLVALIVCSPITSRADTEISVNVFYDNLQPYGTWVEVDDYGYCFEPQATVEDPDWAPYVNGSWAYTEAGWTWVSEEDFGWATYHYGRWIRAANHWCWVPGTQWAPAWVSWRQTDQEIGWAPLPPEAEWNASIGFSTWTDSYYDIGPSYYTFIPTRHFGDHGLRRYVVDRGRNPFLVERSTNITKIYNNNSVANHIYVGGPDFDRIQTVSEQKVRQLKLRANDQDWDGKQGRDRFNGRARIENNDLYVASPRIIQRDRNEPPAKLGQALKRSVIDRGWRQSGDEAAVEKIRERHREEASKSLPQQLAGKARNFFRQGNDNVDKSDSTSTPPPTREAPNRPGNGQDARRPGPPENREEIRKGEPMRRDEDTPPKARRPEAGDQTPSRSTPSNQKEEPKRLKPEDRPDLPTKPRDPNQLGGVQQPKRLPEPPPEVVKPQKDIPKTRPDLPRTDPEPPKAPKSAPESPRPPVPRGEGEMPKVRPDLPRTEPQAPKAPKVAPESPRPPLPSEAPVPRAPAAEPRRQPPEPRAPQISPPPQQPKALRQPEAAPRPSAPENGGAASPGAGEGRRQGPPIGGNGRAGDGKKKSE